jgi:hypothetical protein
MTSAPWSELHHQGAMPGVCAPGKVPLPKSCEVGVPRTGHEGAVGLGLEGEENAEKSRDADGLSRVKCVDSMPEMYAGFACRRWSREVRQGRAALNVFCGVNLDSMRACGGRNAA